MDPHSQNARFWLHYGDLTDSEAVSDMIYSIEPDEVYNLAAQSHVRVSFDIPEYTTNTIALGTVRLLEAIKRSKRPVKFYQASSSEMFGRVPPPQNEESLFVPQSPYAIAKVSGYWTARLYADGYGIFASNGILFNHESPRRGETFVTRKLSMAVARILAKKQDALYLGNLESKRDWGFAPEYVEAMYEILQKRKPDTFVIGTGEAHAVRELVELAFSYAGLKSEKYVKIDRRYYRPREPESLVADSSKATKGLGWEPKVRFENLVKIMVDSDLRRLGLAPIGEGDEFLAKQFPNRWWKQD